MSRLIVLLFLIFSTLDVIGQLDIDHISFKVNNLEQIQVLSKNGIDLYSPEGRLIRHHSEELLGKVSSMDRSSSLKTLIFYEDIPGFQILDNTLTPHGSLINLNEDDLQNVTAVCMSNDNSFWVYDAVNFEIMRFTENFEILERSGNLAVITGEDVNPLSMRVSGNRLFVADKLRGVLVFDLFANYLLRIPFTGLTDMDVTEKWIYMCDGQKLERTDWKGIQTQQLELDMSQPILCIDIESEFIYIGDGKTISKRPLRSLFD